MASHKTRTVAYRRKREGKTNYKKRLKLLLSGKPRLVVRMSLGDVYAQVVQYGEKGDKVVASARGAELKKLGWNYNTRNIPGSYLLGMIIARKAKENGINEAILDLGLNKSVSGSRIFAVLKGAVDNGLQIPHSESVLPKEERISGKHIEEYAKKLKDNNEEFKKRFGAYLKNNADPLSITKVFNDAKNKINGA